MPRCFPLRRLVDLGVSDDMTVSDAKHVRITNIVSVLSAGMVLPWVPYNLLSNELLVAVENVSVGTLMLSVLALNGRGRFWAGAVLLLSVAHVHMLWVVWTFGVASGIWVYYVLVVFLPYLVFRTKYRRIPHIFSTLAVAAVVACHVFAELFPPRIVTIGLDANTTISIGIAASGLLLMAAAFRGVVIEAESALQKERARADSLLLNVLPPSIAERLKAAPGVPIADRYSEVTVLFADVVGFTPLSARLSAGRTVELLNQIFTTFDEICDRARVEKIRTIGDGYMAVAGAPVHRSDHAEAMTRVAIEMREYMASGPPETTSQTRKKFGQSASVFNLPVESEILNSSILPSTTKCPEAIWSESKSATFAIPVSSRPEQ